LLRIIGIVFIFCFSVLLGLYIANNEKQKLYNSKKLFESMLTTKMLLKYSKTDKQKVIKKIDFEYFVECDKSSKIDSEIFSIAKKYFDDMGSRDFNTESELLDFTVKDIESKLNPLTIKYNQNVKLSIAMGFLCALFFVIILI